jgi:cell division septation protein DedD
MSNNYSPDADDQMPEKKSSQQLLLLLLLLLVLLFVYLYFFTGLIKPRGEQPKPPAVAEAPVKKPLPPRPEVKGAEPAKPASPVAKPEDGKAATPAVPPAQPAKPGAPAPKPAVAGKEATPAKPAAGAKEAAPVKPAKDTAPSKTATGAKEAPPAKPAAATGAKPAPAAAAKPVPAAQHAKVAPAGSAPAKESQTKAAVKPAHEAKTAAKQAAGEKTAATAGKKTLAPAKPAAYTLEINGDLAESEIAPVLAKLKQAGITHVVKSTSQKGEPMHRLFLADFANRDEALEELERLKLAAPSAFMLKENGRYAVYAGSYLREAKAATEQIRLQAKGVQVLPKSATTPVAVTRVRAGAFADQAGADKALKALKKTGLTAKAVRNTKVEK